MRGDNRMRTATVIGGGVVGLSCAYEMADSGCSVTVIAAADAEDSVSGVAAALWFPYQTESSADALEWSRVSYQRFTELVATHDSGVDLRSGVVVHRNSTTDTSWTGAVPAVEEVGRDNLPQGAIRGLRTTMPVITSPIYLPWLRAECRSRGVRFINRHIQAIDEIDTEILVVAAGSNSGKLLRDDASLYPIRGQIVRLTNPGLDEWLLDEDNPLGLTYIVPRRGDVICGGQSVVGDATTEWDQALEEAILSRSRALVPALKDSRVLSRMVGLRPGRPKVRVERVPGHSRTVIACYGHGGAGVTLSWGTARSVVRLIEQSISA